MPTSGLLYWDLCIQRRAAGLAGNQDESTTLESWDNYWLHAGNSSAYSRGGATHPAVRAFWVEFFAAARAEFDGPRLADVASGGGAVAEAALDGFGKGGVQLTCIDASATAIAALEKRFPDISAIVADAREMPLPSASFDIVCSQFGVEYAGLDAIAESLRLLSPGGRLALLLHHRGGGIHRQCAASLDAVRQLQSAGFIGKAGAMFEAGFRMLREGGRGEYEAAVKELMPAIRSVESIMRRHGRQVADGSIVKLYTDVREMTARLPNYDEGEVNAWLDRMRGEYGAYEGRMASMCEAAVDQDGFAEICAAVEAEGGKLLRHEALINADSGTALAWVLIAAAR